MKMCGLRLRSIQVYARKVGRRDGAQPHDLLNSTIIDQPGTFNVRRSTLSAQSSESTQACLPVIYMGLELMLARFTRISSTISEHLHILIEKSGVPKSKWFHPFVEVRAKSSYLYSYTERFLAGSRR